MKYFSLIVLFFPFLSCQEGINYNKLGNNLIYWEEAKLEIMLPPDYTPYKNDPNIVRDDFESTVDTLLNKTLEQFYYYRKPTEYAAYTKEGAVIFMMSNPNYFLLLDRFIDDFKKKVEEDVKGQLDSLTFEKQEIFVTRRIKIAKIDAQISRKETAYVTQLYIVNYSDERKSLFILSVSKEPLDLKPYVKSIRFTEAPATAI